MFGSAIMETDTIAAIATAPGTGGIGIIRISGPLANRILERLFKPFRTSSKQASPWVLRRGKVLDNQGIPIDDALAVFMPAPRTFTGEDIVEFQCHGGPVLLETVLGLCLDNGARMAERGEFSRRAFLNGRMDLTQAEAIAEIITAQSHESIRLAAAKLDGLLGKKISELRRQIEDIRAQLCLAIDFPEEEVECLPREGLVAALLQMKDSISRLISGFDRYRCWREGVAVALAGPVNVGKSSLMNALLGRKRAIVTDTPGTTRDFLEESVHLAGLPARLIDTAGLRETQNSVEAQGIRLGRDMIDSADVVLLLVDGTQGIDQNTLDLLEEIGPTRTVVVWNKADLASPPTDWYMPVRHAGDHAAVSAKTGEGLENLASAVRRLVLQFTKGKEPEPDEASPNLRQMQILGHAHTILEDLTTAVRAQTPYDICAVMLEDLASVLAEITGIDATDDVLNRIFSSFCIGK